MSLKSTFISNLKFRIDFVKKKCQKVRATAVTWNKSLKNKYN